MSISPITEVIEDIREGRIVILVDEEDRENEGDLVFAADHVTAEKINFLAKYGRGLICMPITIEHAKRLRLPPMAPRNQSVYGTNFTVAIEAAEGVTTGISAADRAHTIKVASRPQAKPEDIVQPGHVFPLMAQDGGVLMRAGHTEACCDLASLAGLNPSAVLCEIMNDDGTMARLPDLIEFSKLHGLKIGTIADLIQYRSAHESLIERVAERQLQTVYGTFQVIAYRDLPSSAPHLALTFGTINRTQETLVRVHEPLSILDLLETDTTTHSWTVHRALEAIAKSGSGVLVLLNCDESPERLFGQFSALAEVDQTGVCRNSTAQRKMDLRTYGIGAQILRDVGVGKMKLLAKPRKMPSMAGYNLEVVSHVDTFEPNSSM